MKISVHRVKELTSKGVSLYIHVNGKVCGKVVPNRTVELNIAAKKADVFVKTCWCESNHLMVLSDSKLKAYAKGDLMGATFNSLFGPTSTYALAVE